MNLHRTGILSILREVNGRGDHQIVPSGTEHSEHLIKDRFWTEKCSESHYNYPDLSDERWSRDFLRYRWSGWTIFRAQWKNKQKYFRDQGSNQGQDTMKQPVFGILCRNDKQKKCLVYDGVFLWQNFDIFW